LSQTKTIVDNDTGEITENRIIGQTPDFMMVFKDQWENFNECMRLDPLAARLFSTLMLHMNRENALIVSAAALAEIMQVSRATIDRKVKFLRDKGFIQTLRTGGSSVFLINANIVWTTHTNNLRYARFRADIILSESEQEAITLAQHNLKQIEPKAPKRPKAKRKAVK